MKNSQHLKAYVQLHPENKMAWYLLGKEYYKNGQQGKANYCFNQAGEVYEAFEHSKVPAEMLREYEDGLLQAARQRHQNKQRMRRVLLTLVLLLLVFLPDAAAPGTLRSPGETDNSAPEIAGGAPADLPEELTATAVPETGVQPAPAPVKLSFTAQPGDAAGPGKALAGLLQSSQPTGSTAILRMERSGKWLIWKKKLPLEATLEKSEEGRIVYQSYNSAVCACQPPDSAELKKQAAEWQEDQEELAVLWSAMRSYKSSKGVLPKSLGELEAPFPGNWLGGTTPLMKAKFASLRAAASPAVPQAPAATAKPDTATATGIPAAGQSGNSPGASGDAAAEMPFFTGPLTIIVDKQKHRLAVTSGSIILRNYEIGLGGDKTPEGTFTITDKVVNPNGHDNGEFGSRGMQLSDSNYAIHGTNEPDSIGKDESLGCIRMNRKDVEELFAMVPMGTKVQITKGVLPEELLLPEEAYPSGAPRNQTNPHKVYHWLN